MINKSILEHCNSQGFMEKDIYGAYKIFFGTLVSDSRLRIINLLRKGKKNVSQIIEEIDSDQTSVSHDLARLRQCGFVKSSREGKFIYYSLNEQTINPIMQLIDKHMSQFCIHILKNSKENKQNG